MTLDFVLKTSADDDVRSLIAELEAFLRAPGHDPRQHHGYSIERIFQPRMKFFVAYANGHSAGCGGIELRDDDAELKRMYVRPAYRGGDTSRLLIAHLETEARRAGIQWVRLETGDWIVRARAFYAREGYVERGPFLPYADLPAFDIAHSVFMEKRLG